MHRRRGSDRGVQIAFGSITVNLSSVLLAARTQTDTMSAAAACGNEERMETDDDNAYDDDDDDAYAEEEDDSYHWFSVHESVDDDDNDADVPEITNLF